MEHVGKSAKTGTNAKSASTTTAAANSSVTTFAAGTVFTPAALLNLQRTIGNHAVQRMIAANPSLAISAANSSLIQRSPLDFEFEEVDEANANVYYKSAVMKERVKAGYLQYKIIPQAKMTKGDGEYLDGFDWFNKNKYAGVLMIIGFYPNDSIGGKNAGAGGGTAAMHFLALKAKSSGCDYMVIFNSTAPEFYAKMGFTDSTLYSSMMQDSTTANVLSITTPRMK